MSSSKAPNRVSDHTARLKKQINDLLSKCSQLPSDLAQKLTVVLYMGIHVFECCDVPHVNFVLFVAEGGSQMLSRNKLGKNNFNL